MQEKKCSTQVYNPQILCYVAPIRISDETARSLRSRIQRRVPGTIRHDAISAASTWPIPRLHSLRAAISNRNCEIAVVPEQVIDPNRSVRKIQDSCIRPEPGWCGGVRVGAAQAGKTLSALTLNQRVGRLSQQRAALAPPGEGNRPFKKLIVQGHGSSHVDLAPSHRCAHRAMQFLVQQRRLLQCI